MKYLKISLIFLALTGCKGLTDESLPGSRTVTTLSGSTRSFRGLAGVTVDPAGNVFIAERESHLIRKITPSGEISTLAGFSLPTGLASDSAGNIYVADTGSSLIRKIAPDGVITSLCSVSANGIAFSDPNTFFVSKGHAIFRVDTRNCAVTVFAGNLSGSGFSDGLGARARFNGPWDLAVDPSGNLLVADSANNSIRRITLDGFVSTVTANGDTPLNSPFGVTVDGSGNIFVADSGNHTIREILPDGTLVTLAGQSGAFGRDDGLGSSARFNSPTSIALDGAGALFVTDYGNGLVRKLQ